MKVIRFKKAEIMSKQVASLGELLDLLRVKRVFPSRVKKDAFGIYCVIDNQMQEYFDRVQVQMFGFSDEYYDAQYEMDIYDDEKQAHLANIIIDMFNTSKDVESLDSLTIGKEFLARVDDGIMLYAHSRISDTVLSIDIDESLLGFFVDDFEKLFAKAVDEGLVSLIGADDFEGTFINSIEDDEDSE